MNPKIFATGLMLAFAGLVISVQADDSTLAVFDEQVRPVLTELCLKCHGPDEQKGGLRFDELNPDLIQGPDAETWHDVLDQLNLGEMPPQKAQQPTAEQRRLLTEWILAALREATEAKRFAEGRVLTRRLTRYEYANTMRDLLGIDLDFARDLPPEPTSPEGFLNNGATLEMSPTQIEVYLNVARKALAEVIVSGPPPERFEFAAAETAVGNLPSKRVAGHEPVRPEFILDLKEFPRYGEFELKVTASSTVPHGQGLPRMQISMGHVPGIIHVPRAEIGEVDVDEASTTYTFRGRMEDFPQPGPIAFGNSGFKGMIMMIDFLDADGNELRYPDRKYAQPAGGKNKKNAKNPPAEPKVAAKSQAAAKTEKVNERLDIKISSVEFKSPLFASWPPESHRRLIFDSDNAGDQPQYVRELLRRFMRSAFRRPVTEQEVEATAQLFDAIQTRTDSFEAAIREVFASVLVSPHFLYLVEHRQPGVKDQRVDAFELASRLSYFLWSSQPDSQLLELAEQGKLQQPAVLEGEIARIMADPRFTQFIERFVDQWLDLDALNRVAVNPEYFPAFEETLKEHMRRETHAYFAEILHNDRSALELLDSDWAMLNRPLARHYGLDGPRASRFERVALNTEERRGGLLSQGAYLLANSNGEDSHPIKRAVWILDRLLDSPPAPPPPDVPELDSESPDLAKLTLKEQLAVHRQKESCANCHQTIDPWGIPLEHFDAVGRWRDEVPAHRKRPATPVDAASTLPGGVQVDGLEQLQQYLVEHRRDLFARAIVKRMMAYGLGRSLDYGDRQAVERLTDRFIQSDFRLKSLIVDFVQSDAFTSK